MLRKISPLANLVLIAIALSVAGATLPATSPAPLAEATVELPPLPLDPMSATEGLSCNVDGSTTTAWFNNPPFSCKCWQGCCINDACWRGLFLEFCGPN